MQSNIKKLNLGIYKLEITTVVDGGIVILIIIASLIHDELTFFELLLDLLFELLIDFFELLVF